MPDEELPDFDFKRWSTLRDASNLLRGLGGVFLMGSGYYLVYCLAHGWGLPGWFGWGLGPATLVPGVALFAIGREYAVRADREKERERWPEPPR